MGCSEYELAIETTHALRLIIGIKPVMSYVTAVMLHFQSGGKEVTLKARGRAISKAVDVAEVARRRFFAGRLAIKEMALEIR